jgi:hypothetical protein
MRPSAQIPNSEPAAIIQLRAQVEYLAREVAELKASLTALKVATDVDDYVLTRAKIVKVMESLNMIQSPDGVGAIKRRGNK